MAYIGEGCSLGARYVGAKRYLRQAALSDLGGQWKIGQGAFTVSLPAVHTVLYSQLGKRGKT
jgi:hypothetical protein